MKQETKPLAQDTPRARSTPPPLGYGFVPHIRLCAFTGCHMAFTPRRLDQTFHTLACKKAHHNLRMCRGAKIYDAAIKWRKGRKMGSPAALSRLVDDFIDDDRRMQDD